MLEYHPTENVSITAWYISTHRLMNLIDMDYLPLSVQHALQFPKADFNSAILANKFGQYLLDYLRATKIFPFYRVVAENRLVPGVKFTYNGQFYGKGFGYSNKTQHVSLSCNINDVIPGKKLIINFSKSGLTTDTAYSRMNGSTNLFAFCYVAEIGDEFIQAVPYLIGDLYEEADFFAFELTDKIRLAPQKIDQFKDVNFKWSPTKEDFEKMRFVPESQVKTLFCNLLDELYIQKDWGGEESDIFSSNLSIKNERYSAAFLLKGPSKFHEMTLGDCGKNGDQIYRLFNIPADIYILQHCHKVSPAVRKTMEAFALSQYSRTCRYSIIDGYDTARILRSHGMI